MSVLTDKKIKNLQPKEKLYRIFDGHGYGLYLEVLPNGSKKWRLKYRNEGRYKCLTLGTFPDTSLKDARAKAVEHQRRNGVNADSVDSLGVIEILTEISAGQREIIEELKAIRELIEIELDKRRAVPCGAVVLHAVGPYISKEG